MSKDLRWKCRRRRESLDRKRQLGKLQEVNFNNAYEMRPSVLQSLSQSRDGVTEQTIHKNSTSATGRLITVRMTSYRDV